MTPKTEAFQQPRPSIRSMLDRLVFAKEMWSAAIKGREFVRNDNVSLPSLKQRLDDAGDRFAKVVRDVRDRGAWDTAFVDASCDPPQSFTFGGAIAHALTWDPYRRHVVAAALQERGVERISADPLDWQR